MNQKKTLEVSKEEADNNKKIIMLKSIYNDLLAFRCEGKPPTREELENPQLQFLSKEIESLYKVST